MGLLNKNLLFYIDYLDVKNFNMNRYCDTQHFGESRSALC